MVLNRPAGEPGNGPGACRGDDVLVVGAGPVGLVAAIELARRDVRIRIVDAAAGPASGSRGKGIQPRSVEVLDDLGIAGRILATSRSRLPIRKYRGRTVLGTSDVNPDVEEPTAATPYPRTLLIPQWRVEEALRERLQELGVDIEYGTRLVDLEQDSVGVHTGMLTAGRPESASFSYVIGADGASSTVRKLSRVGFLGHTDETVRMLTADVELSGLDRDVWHWWPSSDGKLLALCPLATTDTFQLQIGIAPDVTGDLSLDDIQELVEGRSGRIDVRVRRVAWQSVWRFNVRMVDRYRSGRIFLCGDSAHVHPPAGGLGMNTGIQDAYNLGWKVAHVLRGAPGALLDSYQQERLPIAADVLKLSSELVAGRIKGVVPGEGTGSDTRQLGVHYPVSELNGSGRQVQALLQAGDRAPDALLQTPDGAAVRLFALFRGTHVSLVAFGRRSTQVAEALARRFPRGLRPFAVLAPGVAHHRGELSVFSDAEGQCRRDYGVDADDTLFVVRPDGYVGLRAVDPEETEILQYCRRLLPARSHVSGSGSGGGRGLARRQMT